MRIAIIGGHGQIALGLTALLTERGNAVLSVIRNPNHAGDVEKVGGQPIVLDLERQGADELVTALSGVDAVVFAAGAGPGSGPERKYTVDRDASILLADAAEKAGVRRFVQISTMGAGKPAAGGDESWVAYIDAKTQAENDLRQRDLEWTILRPGSLTNGPATGRVRLTESVPAGSIPRLDVAAVLAELLITGAATGRVLELISGETSTEQAVADL
ncbi:NAD(P)H-binding protein [Nocardia sp. SYP-A9097]|uniref:SDR family oxidoreductase n=1 Tax=Nocardia sp. SYP-A9097 TaxID=2663237 RepID=UPI00129B06E5|nr:SDR family oxidoreductase [Nocardia sp. SYP-A9097]MRH87948.1 NAD(P)H-binding protein [Nocardia sp. SYP-A9097]